MVHKNGPNFSETFLAFPEGFHCIVFLKKFPSLPAETAFPCSQRWKFRQHYTSPNGTPHPHPHPNPTPQPLTKNSSTWHSVSNWQLSVQPMAKKIINVTTFPLSVRWRYRAYSNENSHHNDPSVMCLPYILHDRNIVEGSLWTRCKKGLLPLPYLVLIALQSQTFKTIDFIYLASHTFYLLKH